MVEGPSAFGDGWVALTQFFVHDGTLGDTLTRVSELALGAGPADMVGITMMVEGKPGTAVFTDPEAVQIDERQYATGHGPCLDAFRDGHIHRIESTLGDTPWPEFANSAAEHGILSTLSLPITAREESLGALNLYSRASAAFTDEVAVRLTAFAAQAAIVLSNAQMYWQARDLSENLTQALKSRATIDQATGILMSHGGRSPEEAFQILVLASQRENRKLRDIAAEIVARTSEPHLTWESDQTAH